MRILLVYLLLCAALSAVSLSRYHTTIAGSAVPVRVARPAISLTRGGYTLNDTAYTQDQSPVLVPGDVLTCSYTVHNHEDGLRSQVKMRYRLLVSGIGDPLVSTMTIGADASADWRQMGFSADETHTHTLRIEFPSSNAGQVQFMNALRTIQVQLEAEQMDN